MKKNLTKLTSRITLPEERLKFLERTKQNEEGKMKRSKIIFAVLVISTAIFGVQQTATAQQDAMYSMYMFNGLAVNPAYAGSRERASITALYRHQWTGLEGAPKTFVISGHAPLLNDKIALGGSIASDNISIFHVISMNVDYAYRIKIGKGKLSLGVNATLNNHRARWNELTLNDQNDQAFDNKKSVFNPNFGFGAYYYSDRFYVGASVPHLLNSSLDKSFKLEGTEAVARQWRHYFFTAGAMFNFGKNVKFKPSFLFKYVQNAPFEADLNASFLLKDALWLGASYRTGDAVVVMIEYMFAKNFRAGYAYDITLTDLRKYSGGSHEIMIGYEFGKKEAYLTPRRMSYF